MLQDLEDNSSATALQVKYRCATVDEFVQQFGRNVSSRGIFVRTKEPLDLGTRLKLHFVLQDGSPVIEGYGEVVWRRTQDSADTLPPGMGIRFLRLVPASQTTVDRIVVERSGVESRFELLDGAEMAEEGEVPPPPPASGASEGAVRPRRFSASAPTLRAVPTFELAAAMRPQAQQAKQAQQAQKDAQQATQSQTAPSQPSPAEGRTSSVVPRPNTMPSVPRPSAQSAANATAQLGGEKPGSSATPVPGAVQGGTREGSQSGSVEGSHGPKPKGAPMRRDATAAFGTLVGAGSAPLPPGVTSGNRPSQVVAPLSAKAFINAARKQRGTMPGLFRDGEVSDGGGATPIASFFSPNGVDGASAAKQASVSRASAEPAMDPADHTRTFGSPEPESGAIRTAKDLPPVIALRERRNTAGTLVGSAGQPAVQRDGSSGAEFDSDSDTGAEFDAQQDDGQERESSSGDRWAAPGKAGRKSPRWREDATEFPEPPTTPHRPVDGGLGAERKALSDLISEPPSEERSEREPSWAGAAATEEEREPSFAGLPPMPDLPEWSPGAPPAGPPFGPPAGPPFDDPPAAPRSSGRGSAPSGAGAYGATGPSSKDRRGSAGIAGVGREPFKGFFYLMLGLAVLAVPAIAFVVVKDGDMEVPKPQPSISAETAIGAGLSPSDVTGEVDAVPPPVEVKSEVARAVIETEPPGAQVFWDNRLIGIAPVTLELPLGTEAVVAARKDGYTEASSTLVPKSAGQASVQLKLEPMVHVLHVESVPAGAVVEFMNRRVSTPADIRLPKVLEGPVPVRFRLRGFQDFSRLVRPEQFRKQGEVMRAFTKVKLTPLGSIDNRERRGALEPARGRGTRVQAGPRPGQAAMASSTSDRVQAPAPPTVPPEVARPGDQRARGGLGRLSGGRDARVVEDP